MPLTPDQLDLIETTKEVVIETRSGDRIYRTVIWAVVDGGRVFVRSFLGTDGMWYQRAIADPHVALEVGDIRIPFQAIPAVDNESVEATSKGFIDKYPKGRSVDAMVVPEVLDTTLRLDPID